MLNIYKPSLSKYKSSVIKAIESEWISNYGIYVTNAEDELKKIIGAKYCILMNNGTASTHCLFLSLKYKYPSIKKIYVPNNVFIAPWNCALMEYDKSQLEVMKMDANTLNIDVSEEYIKSLDTNSCVLIVHNLGNIINVPRLKRLRDDIIFVEDNCEGMFGSYEGFYSGTNGSLCSSASFYANKTLTTGEGGAFITNDLDVYKYIKKIYSHGMTDKRYIHDEIAYNYRMTNVQAAFLYDQLLDLDFILGRKKELFEFYDSLFKKEIEEGTILKIGFEPNTVSAVWMYCFILKGIDFDDIENYMTDKNVQVRPLFYDIREHDHLKDITVEFEPIEIIKNGIMIPSYPELKNEEQVYISNCIKDYISDVC